MPQQVLVFIDYQNVYKSARRCMGFENSPSHIDGQFDPRRLGLKLKGISDTSRELCGVFIYRGRPSSKYDQPGQAACDRQIALWKNHAGIFPVTRPLNYRNPYDPKEKGIDVKLAIDFVMLSKHFDIGILFSEDTDLIPALEAVLALKGEGSCEVATWLPMDGSRPRPLRVEGKTVPIHLLDERDYRHVHDATDYTAKRKRR